MTNQKQGHVENSESPRPAQESASPQLTELIKRAARSRQPSSERICKCGARDWGIVHQPLVPGDGWPNLIRHEFVAGEPPEPAKESK